MKSFCVGFFAVLAVLAGSVFSDKTSHDYFYDMFKNHAPLDQILLAVYSNDPVTQYQHLESIQKHIDDNDEYAEYANELKAAAQKIIDAKLKKIGHDHVDVEEYMKAAKDVASGETLENEDLANVVNKFKECKQKMMNASDEEKMAYFNEMIQIGTGRAIDQQDVQKHNTPHHRRIHFTSTPKPEASSEENPEE